ncbi:MAG TPA: hypothetical protein VND70_00455 [Acidimicrobiales bacterium]|nr:hypothetical protein [Acidimicrobiales bacterium]
MGVDVGHQHRQAAVRLGGIARGVHPVLGGHPVQPNGSVALTDLAMHHGAVFQVVEAA